MSTGNYVKAIALAKDINEVRAEIEEARKYYEPRPLSEVLTRREIEEMGIIPLMIECHLIADFLTETCYMVRDIVKSHGFEDVSFMPELKDILKRTDRFASFLAGVSPELCDLITRNETFNLSLHKKFQKHINTRLKHIIKEKRNENTMDSEG